jgi:hypothetical protein
MGKGGAQERAGKSLPDQILRAGRDLSQALDIPQACGATVPRDGVAHHPQDAQPQPLADVLDRALTRIASVAGLPHVAHQIGLQLEQRGRHGLQTYELVNIRAHRTQSGRIAPVLEWRAACCICGREFVTTSTRRVGGLVRTCEEHRGLARKAKEGRTDA